MLKKKALRKILVTTVSIFILFVMYLIPTRVNDKYLDSEMEVEYTSNATNREVYLMSDNHYLVKTSIFIDSEKVEEQVKVIFSYLKKGSGVKLPTGLSGMIPENTNLLDVNVSGSLVSINFSKELLDSQDALSEERMIEAIVYSLTALESIDKVTIQVEGNILENLPKSGKVLDKELTRDFGINKVYDITNRNGIQKVTIYYLDRISNNNYYVPVTKYLNDDREKIKIIIDNLASSYIHDVNLMSYLSSKTTILDYTLADDVFFLNLNSEVLGGDSILEEVEYTLKYSIFDNYDVEKIMLQVEGELIKEMVQ